jgi:predicted nucleotide-binding protein (sugar kinase/HSP70/actin superfamily)
LRGDSLLNTRIGIPRSLFYFKFIPLWKSFFTELGAEIVVSEPTNRRILDDGVKSCVDEACLPIKLFHGHVINLKDKADFIFVPRFTSISRNEYICPEFGGLPDMVRHTLKDLPPLIDTEINMRRSETGAVKAAVEIAALLGKSRHAARQALLVAMESYWDFKYQSLCGVLPFCDLKAASRETKAVSRTQNTRAFHQTISISQATEVSLTETASSVKHENRPSVSDVSSPGLQTRIAVIGHPYNIYDRYISMDLLSKLKKFDVRIKTVEMVGEDDINKQSSKLKKPLFWNYGRKAYGAALHLAQKGEIDGMICVTSFGCGIDSFVYDLIERRVRNEYGIPFIIMTVDEHSGEAGFNTRLEAFIDMLRWRKTNENDVSSSG